LSTVTNPPEVSPDAAAAQHLMQLSTGYIASTCVYLAVKLRLPDLLAAGPRTSTDLARELSVNEDALFRVMRTLASLGVFEEKSSRTFANTLASSMLRSAMAAKGSAPGSPFAGGRAGNGECLNTTRLSTCSISLSVPKPNVLISRFEDA